LHKSRAPENPKTQKTAESSRPYGSPDIKTEWEGIEDTGAGNGTGHEENEGAGRQKPQKQAVKKTKKNQEKPRKNLRIKNSGECFMGVQ
jgi:hypothetical protein